MDETPSNVVEELVRDAVAEQKRRGMLPRPHDAHKYIQGVVERLDKREAAGELESKPVPQDKEFKVERSTADMESEYEKRIRRAGGSPLPGSWVVEHRPVVEQPGVYRGPKYMRAARRRLDTWAQSDDPFGDPKWHDKLERAVAKVAKRDTRAAMEMVRGAVREALMRKRLRQLRSKPEWADRLKVNPLAIQGQLGIEKQKHAHQIVRDVIADSNRVFGDWLKVPATPLWSR